MRRPVHEMLQTVSARLSLHMPASQGQLLFEGIDLYRTETTELPVTDDLFHPLGAIAEAERLLATSAKAKASFLLHGGSTAGVHAMILYTCNRGDTVILPRNVHISALNICALGGIEPVFAEVTQTPEGWVTTSAAAYQKALADNPEASAALAVSSDYYGLLCDLPEIAAAVHAREKLLLCDEAHGAYFNWRKDVQNAGARGADLFVQSAHKTLPCVNAAAWLHAMNGIDTEKLLAILRMVQTSSPSFAVMQSMDDARAWMDAYGQDTCDRLLAAIDRFYSRASSLGYKDDRKPYPADRLRLVLRAPQGGERLQEQLQAMGIDVEMSDTHHIVCILSLLDGEKRLDALLHALEQIPREQNTCDPKPLKIRPESWPIRQMPLSQAVFAQAENLRPSEAVGHISATNIGLYPPGVAWLTAGETVTPEIAEMILQTPPHRLFGASNGIRCVK
ncbi:MAG TPA: aminotransferase class I/II-fold pyridoxal phosphate-dependent enzyme [Candidatus Limiplasma sp.]|nr:aminotransferase class I/II-fold pyridoxal phosphate-dependent enzyme [Candidatus Limiplasma sp.]